MTATSKFPEIGGCGSADGDCGPGGGGPGSGGIWKTVVTRLYTDWYNVRPNGSMDYNGSTSNGYRLDSVWVPSGGDIGPRHSHVTGGQGSSAPPLNDNTSEDHPPSCKSFNFVRKGSLNFQYSM